MNKFNYKRIEKIIIKQQKNFFKNSFFQNKTIDETMYIA